MIYCVEDDAGIRDLVVYTLKSTGFEALGLTCGDELFAKIAEELPQLIILDIMLPGEDGISILNRLKAAAVTASIPVILATAKGAEYDRVLGLDSGADDYLVKPFGMMEMVSRVKAVLRRSEPQATAQILTCGELSVNLSEHSVMAAGRQITLTLKEFELLHLLLEHVGHVFTRDQLLNAIWGYDFDGETRTVDVHIRTLRQKLGQCGRYIETVRGVGYRVGGSYET